ncbi:uncharacterized protein EV420DRAFT_1745229 [Desarmillaria tabescens]|uniref:Uncharacterized protein n=1 Tax=Armillaria tabescens TaxID=1929756 RepID=A0AA39TR67_ARMTA|nr:uncharacterized protein EV420DRAFT_1745229 [Desarmillaria tabescens]KAK0463693.1 hypothetical protein EV420DRAFT_1745229 [Desarmillaria tabescens]
MNYFTPPCRFYFTFSIDVAATLELYCDGGDDAMLQKLSSLESRKYAGYCIEKDPSTEGDIKFHTISIRPVQQGLTKPYPRDFPRSRPAMCIPILPETAHPRFRTPLKLSKPLPWSNCYHPTCFDIRARVPKEVRNYLQTPRLRSPSPALTKPLLQDEEFYHLLRAGVNEDRILRILDGIEQCPDICMDPPDDTSETCRTFLARIPGIDELEADNGFIPVLRIDHILTNVPEISDPSDLWEDRSLFRRVVREYQLSRYGPVLLVRPEEPILDDTLSKDDTTLEPSEDSMEDFGSGSDFSDTYGVRSLPDSDEVSQTLSHRRKGKWKIKSPIKRAITKFARLVRW